MPCLHVEYRCARAFTGATRDIGSALTRLCLRHRSIEHKLKIITGYTSTLFHPASDTVCSSSSSSSSSVDSWTQVVDLCVQSVMRNNFQSQNKIRINYSMLTQLYYDFR